MRRSGAQLRSTKAGGRALGQPVQCQNMRMQPERFLIVQTGRAIASVRARLGDFPHWFRVAMGLPSSAIDIIDVQGGGTLPRHGAHRAVLVTGSGAMVSEREPWSESTAAWLRQAHDAGTPLLGVCYGHQLIAHAFGGRVDYHPDGREMGTHAIERMDAGRDDVLFGNAPATFAAQLTHRQSVLEAPQEAVVLARSAHDPVQAFRIGARTWGVQFHPEFSTAAMRAYIAARAEDLRGEGKCPRELDSSVRAAPHARAILRRFARLASDPLIG